MSGRWYVTLLLLALLFANNRLYLIEDKTGNWPAGAPIGNLGQPIPPEACAVWRQGSVICVDHSQILETDRIIAFLSYGYRDRSGALAATGLVMEGVIDNTVGGAPADPKVVHAAYTAWLAKHPDKFWQNTSARLQTQAVTGHSVRWRTLFRLLSNIFLVVLLVRSLAWTIPIFDALGRGLSGATMTPAERAALRRKKDLSRGDCPACGYDIRGLPTRVCPECAHRWTEHEAKLIPSR
jgi:hypothetical protein